MNGICATLPTTDDELLAVKGIGNKKLEMFGEDILDIVRRHVDGGLSPDEESAREKTKSAIPRPAPISLEFLTAEQRRAAEIVLEKNKSVFISGAAGTGKSHAS